MRVTSIWFAAVSFLGACFSYTPVQVTQAIPRSTVRLTLTEPSHAKPFGSFGSQIRSAEGQVRALADSSLTLSVSELGRVGLDKESARGETVLIPREDIFAIERKRLNVPRSLLATGLITGAALWIGIQGHGNVSQIRTKTTVPGQQ